MTLSGYLKQQTASAHARVEETELNRRLFREPDAGTYFLFLASMLSGYETALMAIRPWGVLSGALLEFWEKQVEALRSDLSGILMGRSQPRSFGLFSAEEAWGAAYVVQGSTLGGIQIRQKLRGLFPALAGRTSFLFGISESHAIRHWKEFCFRMDSAVPRLEDFGKAAFGALKMFQEFEACFVAGSSVSPYFVGAKENAAPEQ